MVYVIYGVETYLINNEIKKIIEEANINSLNINEYNLNDTLIENVIDDALTISLFDDKKIIIVNDAYIFTGTIKKNGLNHNINSLEKYLNINNPNTIIIFKVDNEKLDERKKIVKLIKQKGKLIEYNKNININSIVKEMFKNYIISNNDITYLINRVGNNLELLASEIEKIKIYKDDDLNITRDDINNLTTKNIDLDIFKFIDNIIKKNIEDAIATYNALLKQNEEPIKIIVMLANQIRLMYQAKELVLEGYSELDIVKETGAHPYSVKLALQKSNNYSSITLLNYLNKLADMDINIKSGLVDKNLVLELFILNTHL